MKITFSSLVAFLVFFASCNDVEMDENKGLKKQLIGEWASLDLKINMNTFDNKDSIKVFEVTEENWKEKMGILPIKTIYMQNGIYVTEHRNLKDSIIFKTAGRWNVFETTINMRDTFPEIGPAYSYTLNIKNEIAELSGIEDCDQDGKTDDNYFGRLRRK
jgi:hypothetical protein